MTDSATPTTTSNGFSNDQIKRDVCKVCDKVVYPMDKLVADDKIYHKTCLRCGHCKKVLQLGNYAALNNVFYCKPHFKQLFAVKGNYTDGFADSQELKSSPSPSTQVLKTSSKPSSISSLKSESEASPIKYSTQGLQKSPLNMTSSVDALTKTFENASPISSINNSKEEEIKELKLEIQRFRTMA